MKNIEYLRATSEHLAVLVDTRVAFLSEYWGTQDEVIQKRLKDELTEYFEKAIPDKTYVAWLAKDCDTYVANGGMVIQQRPGSFRVPDGRSAYIMNMFTLPKYRKQGIASTLLNHLIEDGKQLGISFYELHATPDGQPVYIKQGFQLHKEPTYRKFI